MQNLLKKLSVVDRLMPTPPKMANVLIPRNFGYVMLQGRSNEGRLQMELSCLSAVDMERSSCMILVDPIYTGSSNGEEGGRRVKKRKTT